MVIRQEKQKTKQREFIYFLPVHRFGAMLGSCGPTQRRLLAVDTGPIRLKHSRGGPIAEQTTGDRKEKTAITRRIYAKSHMIADVRVRICMPYPSAGVRP